MKSSFKKILILAYSDLSTDPRVIRQINALKEENMITACGYKASDIAGVNFIPIYLKESRELNFHHEYPVPIRKVISLFVKKYTKFKKNQIIKERIALEGSENFDNRYWTKDKSEFIERLGQEYFDLIIANDIETLPLALRISDGKSKVVLDSHEFHPKQFEHNEEWVKYSQKYVEYLCSEFMNKADLTFAVSQGIADEFRKNFNTDPVLLTNATEYNDLSPTTVDNDNIKLIHHGAAIKARNLELMIEMMEHTDERFTLDLMLIPTDKDYFNDLKTNLEDNTKVRLIEPVKTKDIPMKINQYDIGLFILPPVNFNYKHSLPNKLFEFIQARLAIAIGPSVEMEKLVRKFNLGIVADDFKPSTMAERLNVLTAEDIYKYKVNSDNNAAVLSAEKNSELIRGKVNEILHKSKHADQV